MCELSPCGGWRGGGVTQTALSKNRGDEKTGLLHETCTPLQYQDLIRVTKNLFLLIDTDFYNDQMAFGLFQLNSYLFDSKVVQSVKVRLFFSIG